VTSLGRVGPVPPPPLRPLVVELFAAVSESLARATWALLHSDAELAREVVAGDVDIDRRTASLEQEIWDALDHPGDFLGDRPGELKNLVAVLLILPELERSADLAEHIAQRALANVGAAMTPVSRGVVQRMSEVAIEMWQAATTAYAGGHSEDLALEEADEELDILHGRLSAEVATGAMPPATAAQVTLLARFYERIGDHAVNLSRRSSPPATPPGGLDRSLGR